MASIQLVINGMSDGFFILSKEQLLDAIDQRQLKEFQQVLENAQDLNEEDLNECFLRIQAMESRDEFLSALLEFEKNSKYKISSELKETYFNQELQEYGRDLGRFDWESSCALNSLKDPL